MVDLIGLLRTDCAVGAFIKLCREAVYFRLDIEPAFIVDTASIMRHTTLPVTICASVSFLTLA